MGFTAWACVADWGAGNVGNSGPHGFSEIFYAYSSGTANNGTAFGGFGYSPTDHRTPPAQTVYASTMFNLTQTFCMLIGRYFELIPHPGPGGRPGQEKAGAGDVGQFPGGRADVLSCWSSA